MMKFLANLPSTNFRIFVTLLIACATSVRYLISGIGIEGGVHFETWEPSWDWLLFVAAMSGLDLASFYAKRTTDAAYVEASAQAKSSVNVESAAVSVTTEKEL